MARTSVTPLFAPVQYPTRMIEGGVEGLEDGDLDVAEAGAVQASHGHLHYAVVDHADDFGGVRVLEDTDRFRLAGHIRAEDQIVEIIDVQAPRVTDQDDELWPLLAQIEALKGNAAHPVGEIETHVPGEHDNLPIIV